jgi:Lon protease-like protein
MHEEQLGSDASHPVSNTFTESTQILSNSSEDNPSHYSEATLESPTMFALAREHSYLPGTSHPLFPENMLSQRRRLRSSSFDNTSGKRNQRRYLHNNNSRYVEHDLEEEPRFHFVDLAILELQNVVLFPGSTIPIRLHNPAWIDYLGRKIDDSRMLRGISPESSPEEEVRLGILTHQEEGPRVVAPRDQQRQRSSWARSGINGLQGQRLSQVLQEFLLDSDDDDENITSDDPERSEGYSADDSDEPLLRGRMTSYRNSSPNSTTAVRQDPIIGRIGTIATVTYTHEDDKSNAVNADIELHSRVWQSQRTGQIVVTALGTGRFRIIARAEDSRNTLLRIYKVEELVDEALSYPLMCLQRPVQYILSSLPSSHYMKHQEQLIQKLSTITPTPAFVYRMIWPWRMVGLIRVAMDDSPDLEGLRHALPCLDTKSANEAALLEPINFSFWMASNMPFSEEEKLHLLKMLTAIERLRFIYKKVRRHQREDATPNMLCCRWCGIPFASVASMFTVGGAEGTTGAYGTLGCCYTFCFSFEVGSQYYCFVFAADSKRIRCNSPNHHSASGE